MVCMSMSTNQETNGVCIGEIQREYLLDLKSRTSPAHYKNVKQRLERTELALGAAKEHDLQPLAVIRHRNQVRERGASNRTANLVVDSLRAMLTWAVACGLMERNALKRIPRLPDGVGHQRCRRRALSEEEIERFLQAASDDDLETAARWGSRGGGKANHRRCGVRVPQEPMWRAMLETGARWGELTGTTWSDLDAERRTLVLRAENTKSRKQRGLPLGRGLTKSMRGLRSLHERVLSRPVRTTDPIFRSPEGVRWPRPTTNAMRLFDRILQRAKIARTDEDGRKLDIHALRHTFGSRLARNGVGLVHVQRLMGHSDPKLTAQVYTHLDVEDLRSAIETVAAV
jgi:integrase